jgi:hypothetical protein
MKEPENPQLWHGYAVAKKSTTLMRHCLSLWMQQRGASDEKASAVSGRVFYDLAMLMFAESGSGSGSNLPAVERELSHGLLCEPHHPLLLLEHAKISLLLGNVDVARTDVDHAMTFQPRFRSLFQTTFDALNGGSSALLFSSPLLLCQQRPSVFISYAWGEEEEWVQYMAASLRARGMHVWLDRWFSHKGDTTMTFVGRLLEASCIVVVGTPLYLQKYNKSQANMERDVRDHWVNMEMYLIAHVMAKNEWNRRRVLPLLRTGFADASNALPELLRTKNVCDLRDDNVHAAAEWESFLHAVQLRTGRLLCFER